MGFFNNLGKKASEAYKVTADKTSKIAKETKLRMQVADYKSQINDLYKEIGEVVYKKHSEDSKNSITKELEEKCTKIDELTAQIDANLKECLKLKDKRTCPKCNSEVDKNVQFCPNCGEKLEPVVEEKEEEEPAKEAEVVEDKKEEDKKEEE